MLLELRIQNMALIDSLQLDFSERGSGLAVFTGETGAGKSIILQAISLLAGGRGAASWIRSDCDTASVEALFAIGAAQLEVLQLLADNEIEHEDGCIIRRIISREGRSRFYVNDRLVTARLAGELTENLVNIASQHDHQQLLVPRRHLDFLDTFGNLWGERREYEKLFTQWQNLVARLRDLRRKEQDKELRKDFLSFQVQEIREANITPDEDIELEQERRRLKSSTTLGELAGQSCELMRAGILEPLVTVRKNMEQLAAIDEGGRVLSERIVSACYEIEDVSVSLKDYLDAIPSDPYRLEQINDRMALLKQLQRKYGPTMEDVLGYGRAAEEELASFECMERDIADLEKKVEELFRTVRGRAGKLSAARKEAAAKLCSAMQLELASLSFPRAVFEAPVLTSSASGSDSLHASGMDQVEFLFSANPGEPPKPLARVASGGELSRLMLAMKCLLARRDQVNTVVFDEVDAGIGGKAAEAVAKKISELAEHHQVLCITHLPQIAAAAHEHFMVEKNIRNGRTLTAITSLVKEQRVMELARMLGGESLTDQTVAYARELVESNPMYGDL
ncbi:MAG: DNA repair protein RecN [Desulfobulbaceae bacterium]|nr:DNA repair protein RecN [Desulfobulbaceae bacterium]